MSALRFRSELVSVFPVTEGEGLGHTGLPVKALGAVVDGTWPPSHPPALHTLAAPSNNCGIWFPFDTKCETLLEVPQKGTGVNL